MKYPTVVVLSDDIMERMSAKRLLTVFRTVRRLRGHEFFEIEGDETLFKFYDGRLEHIRKILNRKGHVPR